jgi:hypothetical protein
MQNFHATDEDIFWLHASVAITVHGLLDFDDDWWLRYVRVGLTLSALRQTYWNETRKLTTELTNAIYSLL